MLVNYRIAIHQYLNKELEDIYAAMNCKESYDPAGNISTNSDKTTVKFQFHSLSVGQSLSMKVSLFSRKFFFLQLFFRFLQVLRYCLKFSENISF